MVAGIAAASIIAYLAALLGMQKRQVYQQIVFLLIYIIGITALAEMDVVLPMYFLISLMMKNLWLTMNVVKNDPHILRLKIEIYYGSFL